MKAVKVKGKKLNKVKLTLFITPLGITQEKSVFSKYDVELQYCVRDRTFSIISSKP